jgi:hypothetical protein
LSREDTEGAYLTLKEIKANIDKISLTLEEEVREVVAYRLKEKGIAMNK